LEYGLRLEIPAEPPWDAREACAPAWRALLPDGATVALYFGTEFCEDRLPQVDEATAFCRLARDRGWEPTLLTPLVSPHGLAAVGRLLAALAVDGLAPAVVFNDWGVLGLLRDKHASLPRRAGRLVNRSLRDPRAWGAAPAGKATHDASRYARLRAFLERQGVVALESDMDLEGGYLGDGRDAAGAGLARALYLPFTFAASGRACPLKARLYPEDRGFSRALADRCPAPCRSGPLPVPRDDTALPMWRGGNTVFYEVPVEAAGGWLAYTDRVVLHGSAVP